MTSEARPIALHLAKPSLCQVYAKSMCVCVCACAFGEVRPCRGISEHGSSMGMLLSENGTSGDIK